MDICCSYAWCHGCATAKQLIGERCQEITTPWEKVYNHPEGQDSLSTVIKLILIMSKVAGGCSLHQYVSQRQGSNQQLLPNMNLYTSLTTLWRYNSCILQFPKIPTGSETATFAPRELIREDRSQLSKLASQSPTSPLWRRCKIVDAYIFAVLKQVWNCTPVSDTWRGASIEKSSGISVIDIFKPY